MCVLPWELFPYSLYYYGGVKVPLLPYGKDSQSHGLIEGFPNNPRFSLVTFISMVYLDDLRFFHYSNLLNQWLFRGDALVRACLKEEGRMSYVMRGKKSEGKEERRVGGSLSFFIFF